MPTNDYYGPLASDLRRAIQADDAGAVTALARDAEAAGKTFFHVAMAAFIEEAYAGGHDAALRALFEAGVDRLTLVQAKAAPHPAGHCVASAALKDGRIPLALDILERGGSLSGIAQNGREMDALAQEIAQRPGIPETALERLFAGRRTPTISAQFLHRALEAGRADLAERLLGLGAVPGYPSEPAGVNESCHLIYAVAHGLIDLIPKLLDHGARATAADRDGLTALHVCAVAKQLSMAERIEAARLLIAAGALPQSAPRRGKSAYELARERGLPELASAMSESEAAAGPRYSREARQRGIQDIRLFYDKADGLIWVVSAVKPTFFVGGDYNGAYWCELCEPNGGKSLRDDFARVRRRDPALAWFEPFLEKILNGEDFSLNDVLRHCRETQLVRFGQNSNWRR